MSRRGSKAAREEEEAISKTHSRAKAQAVAQIPIAPSAVQYTLRKFDPRTIRDFATILVAGGRRSGKSFCMRDILYWLRTRVYDCYAYSGTIDEEHPWDKYTPAKYVTRVRADFPNDHLQAVLDKQEVRKAIAMKHGVECPPSMFVFEDLEFLKKSMWKNQSIREVMFNGRWKKSFAIAAVQYIMEIDMAVRSMFDYAIFTMCPVASVRERIWKQYAGIFPTYQEFEAAFVQCTTDHSCMVIDCRATSYRVEDTVFHYKAADKGFFHIGVPEIWDPEIDERNKDHEAEDAAQAPALAVSKKKSKKELEEGGISVKLA